MSFLIADEGLKTVLREALENKNDSNIKDTMIMHGLQRHPSFNKEVCLCFLNKVLYLQTFAQARNLHSYALKFGIDDAILWLHRVYKTTHCDVRLSAEIFGIDVSQKFTLSNGVSFMPLQELSRSQNRDNVLARYDLSKGFHPDKILVSAGIGATLQVLSVPAKTNLSELNPYDAIFRETISALCLIGETSTVIGNRWIDFVHEDLSYAEFGYSWQPMDMEGPYPSSRTGILDISDFEDVERFFSLEKTSKATVVLALERLNLARRRRSPENQAIEGSIALEALLGDAAGEIVHKVSVRAALLLGGDLASKKAIRSDVKKFYGIRSKAVHGKRLAAKDIEKARAEVKKGLSICAEILRKTVKAGGVPKLDDLDISPSD